MTKKGKMIMAGTALILAVLFYLVLSNSHIDIFPGLEREYDYVLEMDVTNSRLVSLLDYRRGYADFTILGYIVAVLVILGIPAFAGYFAGKKLGGK